MQHIISLKTKMLLPLVFLSAVLVTPAYANWFYDSNTGISRNVGSAPSPTPQNIRESRQTPAYPSLSRGLNEQGKVGLRISLTDQGVVNGAVVESSSGFLRLDDAAVDYAMGYWQYRPDVAGQPSPATVLVDVTFRLQ